MPKVKEIYYTETDIWKFECDSQHKYESTLLEHVKNIISTRF
jgi:hypothetical protein